MKLIARVEWIFLGLALTGCVSGADRQNQRTVGPGTTVSAKPPSQALAVSATLTGTFTKSQLIAAGLKAQGTTYKFSFLDQNTAGTVDFGGGDTAEVTIAKGLTIGQSGTVALDVIEGGVVKLHGEKAGVTLVAGDNNLDLDLNQMDANATPVPAAATLRLTLRVHSDQPQPTPGPQPGDGLPVGWDGKSFLGNLAWSVSPSAL